MCYVYVLLNFLILNKCIKICTLMVTIEVNSNLLNNINCICMNFVFFSKKCWQPYSSFSAFCGRVNNVRTGGFGTWLCDKRHKAHYSLRP